MGYSWSVTGDALHDLAIVLEHDAGTAWFGTIAIDGGEPVTFRKLELGLRLVSSDGDTTDPDADTLIARMTTPPSAARAAAINDLVVALKAAGTWDRMDALYVCAAHTEQAAGLNWKSTSFTLSKTGTVTFTEDVGFTGDASTGFMDTSFNPATASSPHFVQDDAHLGAWFSAHQVGCGNANARLQTQANTSLTTRANSTGTNTSGLVSVGHVMWSRDNSADYDRYLDGADFGTITATSSGVSSNNFEICRAINSQFVNGTHAIVHFGSAFTAQQASDTYDAFNAYMAAL